MRYLIGYEMRVAFPGTAVQEHQCELRIAPRDDACQHVHALDIVVEPQAHLFAWTDWLGNRVHNCSILPAHEHLTVRLEADIETVPQDPLEQAVVTIEREGQWIAEALRAQPRLIDYVLHPDEEGTLAEEELERPAPPRREPDRPLRESVRAAMAWARQRVTQDSDGGERNGDQQPGTALRGTRLLVGVARQWGIPARFVTGYYAPSATEGNTARARHAWAEILIPGVGWRGFDPMQDALIDERYIACAVGRDARDTAPLRQSFVGPGGHETLESLRVAPQQ